jgi:hypothetical protein
MQGVDDEVIECLGDPQATETVVYFPVGPNSENGDELPYGNLGLLDYLLES